jgi:hypothetical protein
LKITSSDPHPSAQLSSSGELFNLLMEIGQIHPHGIQQLLVWAALIGGIYLFSTIFVSGGIYRSLMESETMKLKDLFSHSLEHFPAMLRVFVLTLIIWAFSAALIAVPIYLFWNFAIGTENQSLVRPVSFIWMGFSILVVILSVAIYDICRIRRLKTGKNTLYCLASSTAFVFGNKTRLLAIFSAFILAFLVSHLAFFLILKRLDDVLPWFVTLALYQIFIFAKYYIKVTVMNAEILVHNHDAVTAVSSQKSEPQ